VWGGARPSREFYPALGHGKPAVPQILDGGGRGGEGLEALTCNVPADHLCPRTGLVSRVITRPESFDKKLFRCDEVWKAAAGVNLDLFELYGRFTSV